MKKKLFISLLSLIVCCFWAMSIPVQSHAKTITLKLAHNAPPKTLYERSALKFAERVAYNTNGRIKIKVFGASQLGSLVQLFSQVKAGAVDMVFSDHFAGFLVEPKPKNFFITIVPYLFESKDHFHRYLDSDLFQSMMANAEKGGNNKFLGVLGDRSYRILSTSKNKVITPADCKGLKVRVPPAPPYVAVWKLWGGTPTPTPATEIYTSMKSGLVDGQDQSILVNVDAKFYEVQKYAMKLKHVPSAHAAWINQDKWNSFDAKTKSQILKSAQETNSYINGVLSVLEPKAEKVLQQKGMVFIDPDIKAFRKIAESWVIKADADGKLWEKGLYEKIQALK